jgi:hypothetical protein
MLFVFQGALTIGFQATIWVYPSEILPLKLRHRGASISASLNWIFNFLIVYITPPAIGSIKWRFYIIFAILNATWVPIMVCCASRYKPYLLMLIQLQYFFFPETKGLHLEDVDRLFAKENWTLEDQNEKRAEQALEVQCVDR